MATFQKRALLTGLGDGYFDFMTEEDTTTTAPVYEQEVKIVPSLETIEAEINYESEGAYYSNKKHSDLGRVADITLTINAAYLPQGFAERATGAKELAPGVYGYDSNPKKEYFRFAFPVTDENGGEILYNFPKCQLEPVGITAETETDTKTPQVTAFNIICNALVYKTDLDGGFYLTADGTNEAVVEAFDLDKLLEQGWIDIETLNQAKKTEEESDPVEESDSSEESDPIV